MGVRCQACNDVGFYRLAHKGLNEWARCGCNPEKVECQHPKEKVTELGYIVTREFLERGTIEQFRDALKLSGKAHCFRCECGEEVVPETFKIKLEKKK